MSKFKYVVRVIKPANYLVRLLIGSKSPKVVAQKEFDNEREAQQYVRECISQFKLMKRGYNVVRLHLTELEINI